MTKKEQKELFNTLFARYTQEGFYVFRSEIDSLVKGVLGQEVREFLLNLLIDITLDLDRWDLALQLLQECLARFPHSAARLNNMGVCLAELNRNEEAYVYLKQSLEICPDDQLTLKVACEVAGELEKFDEALPICRAYFESTRYTRHASLWYAFVLVNNGHNELAKIIINEYTNRHGHDEAFSEILTTCDED